MRDRNMAPRPLPRPSDYSMQSLRRLRPLSSIGTCNPCPHTNQPYHQPSRQQQQQQMATDIVYVHPITNLSTSHLGYLGTLLIPYWDRSAPVNVGTTTNNLRAPWFASPWVDAADLPPITPLSHGNPRSSHLLPTSTPPSSTPYSIAVTRWPSAMCRCF